MTGATYYRNVDRLTPALLRRIDLHKTVGCLVDDALKVEEKLETDIPSIVLLYSLMKNEQTLRANDPATYERLLNELVSTQPDAIYQTEIELIVEDILESIATPASIEDFR